MARIKFYLDTRPTKDGRCHIKLSLSHKGTSALMPTGVFIKPEQWNCGDSETEPHIKKTCTGYRALNNIITEKFEAAQQQMNELVLKGKLNSYTSATQIKNHIIAQIEGKPNGGNVEKRFLSYIARCNKPGTASLYKEALAKITKYSNLGELRFEDITVAWLKDFESKLRKDGLATNTIARHLRNVRSIYNDAIDYDVVSLASYPFRRFKITHEKTAKRSLTVEQLRQFRDYPCESYQEKYRDIFMLTFYLGGINMIDLFNLTEMPDGRIEYKRSKTGVHVNLKIQPEAMKIIECYRGKEHHLLSMADRYSNYENFVHRMDKELKKIGTFEMVENAAKDPKHRKKNKKKITPLFPKLSTYWARHSVATLMAEIDIPDATIDRVLAHADNSIAAIYIKRNRQKVDDAMRKVIDYLNEG